MKANSIPQCLLLYACILLVLTTAPSQAQKYWSKYPGNPVLKPGNYDEFDGEQVKQPAVIFDSGVFKMWYVGRNKSREQIGYAESIDGIHWIKKGPILPLGQAGDFDCIHQNTPDVVKINSTYFLWYAGFDGSEWRIGKAVSFDGIYWEKRGVVLTRSQNLDFDAYHVLAPKVVLINSDLWMWYEGFDGKTWRIGLAISKDGVTWTKQGMVLDVGSSESFDAVHVAQPEVHYQTESFEMWYSAFNGRNWWIAYATSLDGKSWTKHGVVLKPGPSGSFDCGDIGACTVINDRGRYEMWYEGSIAYDWKIGYAVEREPIKQMFVDVTEEAGLSGNWDAGLAFGDLNNDGYQDLYIGNRFGSNALFMNQVGSRFMNIGRFAGVDYSGYTMGVSWADFNNDGNLDVYLCNYNLPNILYKNKGDAIFADITGSAGVGTELSSYHAVWGDYNNDGLVDLFVVNFGRDQPNILYKNNGDETFSDVTQVAGINSLPSQISRNAMWGDYDNDGFIDLYVVSQGQDVLYRNNGDGTFTDVTSKAQIYDSGNGHGCAWADYDNNGLLDLYVTNRDGVSVLYKNIGDGTFVDVTTQSGLGIVQSAIGGSWADMDNDGDLDLFVTNLWGQPNYLFFNNGTGEFENIPLEEAGLHDFPATNATFGDYDNDGAIDLVMTLNDSGVLGPCLYHNLGNSNHWLIANLIGSVSNRSAIGAKLRLKIGNRIQYREVSGGCGDFTFDSLPVEFGLGEAIQVDSLCIYWPSGIKQVLTNLQADQIITIEETSSAIEQPTHNHFHADFYLSQNFPNPFNPETIISYQMPIASQVEIGIYNVASEKIVTLVTGYQNAGYHQVIWNGCDEHHHPVPSGIYWYRMTAGKFVQTKKMVLLR
ncbi:MAG: FG-GAP-like repeat-containing protein [candidate division KSB1 bacterium]|nr:FG-GAP-like repeat-containing protein [candidate division KSB1 bacterium]